MYEYSGAIHIHSIYSDGTGTIEEISAAAGKSGIDFIVMTDHNTLKPKFDGYEKWMNNVMVLIGYEVNDTHNKNHYITLGTEDVIGSYEVLEDGELGCTLKAGEYVKKIKDMGGIGFIAHPDEERFELKDQRCYPWTEWETDDFTGIEIWNHMSEWVEGLKSNNKLNRFLHPLKTINSPPYKTLRRWDELAQRRHITGIGGIDAHAFKQNLLGLFKVEIFAYKVLFKSIRTHVLCESELSKNDNTNFVNDKTQILNSLKTGKCFVANHYLGNATGFRFDAGYSSFSYTMGSTISKTTEENVTLRTQTPEDCQIRLIYNGECLSQENGRELKWAVKSPGVYRIECYKGTKGWIFSNHIRIFNSKPEIE